MNYRHTCSISGQQVIIGVELNRQAASQGATSRYIYIQWSNYQKISKGAHTIVNDNEAMLLITGGSRTSEPGDKFFPKFFNDFFTGVSEKLSAFPPKKFSSIYLPKFLTFFLVIDIF